METYQQDFINISRDELITQLQNQLSTKRFNHVIRVETTAIALAEKYGANTERASIASLLHDYAKEKTVADLLKFKKHPVFNLEWLDYGSEIWHGPLAAMIASTTFGVSDINILNAVRNHTIGGLDMSLDEKVLFIADYIEPGRQFKKVAKARKLADISLDQAVDFKIKQTLRYLIKQGVTVYPQTLIVYNNWIENYKKGENI